MSISNQSNKTSISDGKNSKNDPNLEKLFESILIKRNACSDIKQEQQYINLRLTKLEDELQKEKLERKVVTDPSYEI